MALLKNIGGRLAVVFATAITPSASYTGTTGADDASLQIDVIQMRLREFSDLLTNLTGMPIEVAPAAHQVLSAGSYVGTLEDVLTALAQTEQLDWFAFNGSYYVSRSADATSRVIGLGDMSYDEVMDLLEDAGLRAVSLRQTELSGGTAIVMTGPAKMIAFAEAVIENAAASRPARRPDSPHILIRRALAVSLEPVDRRSWQPDPATSEPSPSAHEPEQNEGLEE